MRTNIAVSLPSKQKNALQLWMALEHWNVATTANLHEKQANTSTLSVNKIFFVLHQWNTFQILLNRVGVNKVQCSIYQTHGRILTYNSPTNVAAVLVCKDVACRHRQNIVSLADNYFCAHLKQLLRKQWQIIDVSKFTAHLPRWDSWKFTISACYQLHRENKITWTFSYRYVLH